VTRPPIQARRRSACVALLTLAAFGAWAGPAAAQTIITTNVASNTTWSVAGSPYILEAGTIKVLSGVTLTIEPGVTVEMNPSRAKYQGVLSVSGTVRAIGTAASPITFTSAQAAAGVGAPGQWGNVNIVSGNASSQFSYVDFYDGGSNSGPCFGNGALAVGSGSTVSVDHSVFELNASSGLHVSGALANVSYSTFAHNCVGLSGGETMNVSHSAISYNNLEGANGDDGVFINGFKAGSAASTFTENTIRANGRHGIEVSGGCTYELSLYPHGERNNIYENNPSSQVENQLALTPNVTPCKPPLAVNWNNNYWGPEVYYETNPAYCAGTATPYKGHLAYAWYELGNPWDEQHGPINGDAASYHPESGIVVCGWDNFLVEELLHEPVANGAPALPEPTEPELRGGYSEAGPNLNECHRGDPVNCATGKLVETQRDLYVPGLNGGLTFTRTYNSQAAIEATSPGPFGYGWSFGFGASVSVDPTTHVATVTNANGSAASFTPTGGGAYTAAPWVQATLVLNGEGNYVYTLPDQEVLTFNSSGQLQKLVDRNGNTTTLAYTAGRLETATDPGGRKLTLAYNSEGLVESVKDPVGHTVQYGYESGKLLRVTEPGEASPRWQFKYDSSHQLTEITDGRGGKTSSEYDSSHRVIVQKDPLGRKTTWTYRTGDTQVTDPAGNVTDMTFAGDLPMSVTDGYGTARATTRRYTYNAGDAPITSVNGNGRVTSYTYDGAGNCTSLTDPNGHETTWTYNTTHDVISVTTPRARPRRSNATATATPKASPGPPPPAKPKPQNTHTTPTAAPKASPTHSNTPGNTPTTATGTAQAKLTPKATRARGAMTKTPSRPPPSAPTATPKAPKNRNIRRPSNATPRGGL
jgi:YD repeat-containing protein